jgi:hypothetical protein
VTPDAGADSFGPYAFTLSRAEAEAAAARAGLRRALKGGLIATHVAPLTAFALIMVFASVLALTGLIGRRAGEATLILAAAAFMIQRLMVHWGIRHAQERGRIAIAQLESASSMKAMFGDESVAFDIDGRSVNLRYTDCEQAEDAGGLIYVWPREGPPIVVPTRVLDGEDEAACLVSQLSEKIRGCAASDPALLR